MSRKIVVAFAAFLLLSAASDRSFAEDAMNAYKQSMDKMNSEMKKGMEDTDATKAWAKMMVAHHQGAIEMNETVLKETKDPTIRKMAEKGIKEQKEEQKMLNEWIGKHDK